MLYSKIRPALGKVCLAPERGLCSADMYPITPRSDLRPLYLMYFMLSTEFTAGVVLLSSRVAMPKMNRRDLGGFAILVPPLNEQDEIIEVDSRESTQELIPREPLSRAIDKLRQYRSGPDLRPPLRGKSTFAIISRRPHARRSSRAGLRGRD